MPRARRRKEEIALAIGSWALINRSLARSSRLPYFLAS
jgi:hypothetical protein